MTVREPHAAVRDSASRDRFQLALASCTAAVVSLLERVTAPRSGDPGRRTDRTAPDGSFTPSPRSIRAMERL